MATTCKVITLIDLYIYGKEREKLRKIQKYRTYIIIKKQIDLLQLFLIDIWKDVFCDEISFRLDFNL